MNERLGKPKGKSGAIGLGPEGVAWHIIDFPEHKAGREEFVAKLFVGSFERWVATESDPSLKPFAELTQNPEDDLDFSVHTSQGPMLLELAEFAPLAEHGPKFGDAPRALDPDDKAELAVALVRKKSQHQGGASRILVLYVTEHGFWLDPITIERMRRCLANDPPNFERVYYVSIHDQNSASASEIFPGIPHHIYGDKDLDAMRVMIPHPLDAQISKDDEEGFSVSFDLNKKPSPEAAGSRKRLNFTYPEPFDNSIRTGTCAFKPPK